MLSGGNPINSYSSVPGAIEPTPLKFDLDKIKFALTALHVKNSFDPFAAFNKNNSDRQVAFNLNHPEKLPSTIKTEREKYVGQLSTNEENLKSRFNITTGDFNTMTDAVKSSYIGEIYDQLVDWHNANNSQHGQITRVHCVHMANGSGYRMHVDQQTTIRYHVAVETNEYCYMFAKAENEICSVHIPADGRVWLLDTRTPHTALNLKANIVPKEQLLRTHLIFSVI